MWHILMYQKHFKFLARVLAKALKMLFSIFLTCLIKFSTFSTFSISDEIIIEIYHQIFNLQFFFDQIESDLSKMDQKGSNLIKLDTLIKFSTFSMFSISDEIIIEINHQIFNFQFFDQIESDLSKMDQT